MPIGEALIHVECDKCGHVSDPYDLTPTAGGGWDARDIPKTILREGWTKDGERTICPECANDGSDIKSP